MPNLATPSWHSPPCKINLTTQETHIWRGDLNVESSKIEQLERNLAPDELKRANRFHFAKDRQHFIAGRGFLRKIISLYGKLEPHELQFKYGSHGKPILANSTVANKLTFNLSHSQGLALYAIGYQCSVGIDLEHIRPIKDVENLAKRFFSSGEYDYIASFPPMEMHKAFFQFWTCKEAYLKAIGEGLAGLEKVEVSLKENDSPQLLKTLGNSTASDWFLHQFIPCNDYIATVAVNRQNSIFRYWDFRLF